LASETHTIVGRDTELETVRAFVDSLDRGPAAMLLTGEAGIGKSIVWREGLRLARDRGCEVLQCRPVEAEAQLAFAALSDLLGDVPPDAFAALPDPQRRALDVALLRAEPDGDELLPHAVGLAVLGLVRERSTAARLVIAIDDAHWLDQASRRVLAFAIRRVRRERVGLLVASRPDASGTILDDIDDADDLRVTHLRLGSLGSDALAQMLRNRLGGSLTRRSMAKLEDTSGGNPMFALHIGRALLERDTSPGDSELTIPESLLQLVSERLDGLGTAISAVQVAAVLSRPSVSLVAELLGTAAHDALRMATEAGVLAIDGDRLSFTHPLLATAAYSHIDRDDRRKLHARVAGLVDDVEDQARHLALAAEQPDADVARALDVAARRARARGAPDAAAELWEAAARLTPVADADAARSRRFEAALCRFQLGDVARARQAFDDVLAECPDGSVRLRLLIHRAWAVAHIDGFAASTRAFRSALAEVGDDCTAEIELEEGLAWSLQNSESVTAALPHAARALELAERYGDSQVIGIATTLGEFLRSLGGHGLAVDTVGQTLLAVGLADRPEILCRPEWLHGLMLQWEGRLPEARDRFQTLHDEAVARGDEQSLPFVQFHLARTQLLLGDWADAERSAEACVRMTIDSGQQSERPYAAAIMALVQAHLGAVEVARAEIAAALELGQRFAVRPAMIEMLATRGFIDISLGRYEDAERTLEEATTAAHDTGLLEPGLFRCHGDAIETKIVLGRLDEAAELLAVAQAQASALDRPWLRLIGARCHGLLDAARGDLDTATNVLADAIRNDRSGQPFEHARTQLALGSVHRRNRQKRAARDSLVSAVEGFDRLGARLWVGRAQSELARVGGRAPNTEALTATERQVAELIASGRTYREAAAELFISPKTVQWNLSKVYSKLGIRSRAELPGRLHED
jgi:DNA-binding CsgD family transcriptional regulator